MLLIESVQPQLRQPREAADAFRRSNDQKVKLKLGNERFFGTRSPGWSSKNTNKSLHEEKGFLPIVCLDHAWICQLLRWNVFSRMLRNMALRSERICNLSLTKFQGKKGCVSVFLKDSKDFDNERR